MTPPSSRPPAVAEPDRLSNVQPPAPARLGVLTSLGALSGAVPLPFVPTRLLRGIRGAIAHDIASRHGVSLNPAARSVLAEPDSSDARRADLLRAATFVASRLLKRIGPLGLLAPALAGLDSYALGHLLERYFARHRHLADRHMGRDEAASVRHSIDRALIRCLSPDLRTPARDAGEAPPDDQRDETTRLADGALLLAASIPEYLVRRLDAAFDAIMSPDAPQQQKES